MKTPDEIKKGLELCYEDIDCSECPYLDECFGNDEEPFGAVMPDALAYIQQLEAANTELLTQNKKLELDKTRLLEEGHELRIDMIGKIKQLERERDAAVADLEHVKDCDSCKYDNECITGKKDCFSCHEKSCPCMTCKFEWRGVKEE